MVTQLIDLHLDILSQIINLYLQYYYFENSESQNISHLKDGFYSVGVNWIGRIEHFHQKPMVTLIGCLNKKLNSRIFQVLTEAEGIEEFVNTNWFLSQCPNLKSLQYSCFVSECVENMHKIEFIFPSCLVKLDCSLPLFQDKRDDLFDDLSILPKTIEILSVVKIFGFRVEPYIAKMHNYPPNLVSFETNYLATEEWIKRLPSTLTHLHAPKVYDLAQFLPLHLKSCKIDIPWDCPAFFTDTKLPDLLFLDFTIYHKVTDLIFPLSLTHLKVDIVSSKHGLHENAFSALINLLFLDFFCSEEENFIFPPNLTKMKIDGCKNNAAFYARLPRNLLEFLTHEIMKQKHFEFLPLSLRNLSFRLGEKNIEENYLEKLPPNLTKLNFLNWSVDWNTHGRILKRLPLSLTHLTFRDSLCLEFEKFLPESVKWISENGNTKYVGRKSGSN
jgi:hypothetical protein